MTNHKDTEIRLLSANNDALRKHIQDLRCCLDHVLDFCTENNEALQQQAHNLQRSLDQLRKTFVSGYKPCVEDKAYHKEHREEPACREEKSVPDDDMASYQSGLSADGPCLSVNESCLSESDVSASDVCLTGNEVVTTDEAVSADMACRNEVATADKACLNEVVGVRPSSARGICRSTKEGVSGRRE